jgi:hypothetical protein
MKALLAACLALVTLTGCTQALTFGELADGPCTDNQSRLVQEHIGAQITALSREDWESAYSYASSGFREVVTLDQFILVIGTEYQMLITSEATEYGSCSVESETIIQDVRVTSQEENFQLTYELSYVEQILGIESASVALTDPLTNI